MVAKKINVPDIGSLLGQIAEKRDSGELPRTEVQRVQPVETEERMNVDTLKSKAGKTEKQKNRVLVRTDGSSVTGRPTMKAVDIDYVKLSPRIPKGLKKTVEIALVEERFKDEDGRVITTMDEIVAFALARLMK